jgi:hypothetical protein
MKLHKYSFNDLAEAVERSTSLRQVLLKLRVAPYSGNYAVLRKAITHFGPDISHFMVRHGTKG